MSTANEAHIEGLTTIASNFGPKETIDRLETELRANEMEVFARIDHAAGAAKIGLMLRPIELVIFGNARGGTPLMRSVQTVGIDLPLKALVWEDAARKTWISYNEPKWIAQRHGIANAEPVVAKMADLLRANLHRSSKSSIKEPNMNTTGTLIPHTSIRRVEADCVTVFYREAGPANAPVVLLLHGFPTSSFQYRELIPRLADRYRVIAPDHPRVH